MKQPWKELVEKALATNMKDGNKDSINIQLATMPLPGAPPRPSVRTVVFRGFAGQPRKDDDPTGGNPIKGVTSDLMLVSTDTRMLKAQQISAQQASGGNGFEVCWWHQGTQEQFRIAGLAWLLCPPDSPNASFPGDRLKSMIDGAKDWTWERERLRVFKKHSPGLRGSFMAPDPGSASTPEKRERTETLPELPDSLESAKTDEERENVTKALSHFGLLVLEVQEIERLTVSPPPTRTKWTLKDGKWEEHELSP